MAVEHDVLNECVDLVSVHDSYGVYLYANASFRRFLGYAPADLLGKPAYEFFHPEDVEAISTSHGKSLYDGQPNVVTYRIRRADGRYAWVETTRRTVQQEAEDRGTIYTVTRPISHRTPEAASFRWLPDPDHRFET